MNRFMRVHDDESRNTTRNDNDNERHENDDENDETT